MGGIFLIEELFPTLTAEPFRWSQCEPYPISEPHFPKRATTRKRATNVTQAFPLAFNVTRGKTGGPHRVIPPALARAGCARDHFRAGYHKAIFATNSQAGDSRIQAEDDPEPRHAGVMCDAIVTT